MAGIFYKNVLYGSGGGGGGGNITSYGHIAPSTSGNDGDTYILLDSNNKKTSQYLYMNNAWALIEGSGYKEPSIYIPYSTSTDIICEATTDNFDDTALTWGEGDSPVILSSLVTKQDGVVYIPSATSGTRAYVDIGEVGHSFTAYIVAKAINPTNISRLFSCFVTDSPGQGIMLYGSNIGVSSYSNDTLTGVFSTSDYWVGVIQFTSSGNALGKVNSISAIAKPPTTCGEFVVIGNATNGVTSNPTDMLVKYLGVVKSADSLTDINYNVANLMDIFGIV